MEGPTIPKAVLDNLLASMGSSALVREAATYGRPNNGYAPLPVPLFHGANQLRPTAMVPPTTVPLKNLGASLPPLPGFSQRREPCSSPPSALFKDCADPLVGKGSAILPCPVKEKPKRVRKSRAGTTPRKRGISDLVLDASAGGAAQQPPPPPQASPPKRRRMSAKPTGDADKGEKPPPRKRNRTRSKAKDEHAWSSPTNETSFSNSRSDTNPPNGSLLGVYELETKPPDSTRYMKDTSLEGLMAGDFSMPSLPRKQGLLPPGRAMDSSFGSHVSSILQNLTRPLSVDQSMQQAALLSKPPESKPMKFSFDLESTPLDGGRESTGGTFCDNGRNPPCFEAPTMFSQSRKTQERASLFSLEAVPAIPPADFWNRLQINPNVSLNSLITQASANFDSRFPPVEVGSSFDKLPSTLPPSIFSLSSKQGTQESTCDRLASSKLNHWFSAEAPKQTLSDALPVLPALLSQSGKFPFKLYTENNCVESGPPPKPAEKSSFKEGLFNIDLNEQSPEAEAAETVAHSTSIAVPKPEVVDVSHIAVQAKIEMGSIDGASSESKDKGLDLDVVVSVKEAMVPVKEAENPCITDSVTHGDVVGHMENKGPISSEDGELARRSLGSSLLFVDRKESSEQVKDTSTKASISSLTLSVPDAQETEEICCDDVPYSPGMQATARLLCKMALSSSPFYVEDGEKDEGNNTHASVSCNDDVSLEHPADAATVAAGCVEKDGRAQKYSAIGKEHKAPAKDLREKYLYSPPMAMATSSTMVAEKEPWAWTPPRHPPKHVASRVSGSQSSESERSHAHCPRDRTSSGHGHGPRDRTSNGNHGSMNKTMQRDHQHGVVTTFSRASSSFTIKEPKGSQTTVPKTSLLHALPSKDSSVLTPKKSLASEAKQHSPMPHGEGSTKISRPRSNMSKSFSQAQQRSLNGFPVQPRNLNGCSKKSPTSRHVLPFVGEVRNGSK